MLGLLSDLQRQGVMQDWSQSLAELEFRFTVFSFLFTIVQLLLMAL